MTGSCALPPTRVAAADDRKPPFAMFRRCINQRPLRADLCRRTFPGEVGFELTSGCSPRAIVEDGANGGIARGTCPQRNPGTAKVRPKQILIAKRIANLKTN